MKIVIYVTDASNSENNHLMLNFDLIEMKKASIYLSFIALLIGFSFCSCEKEKANNKQLNLTGRLISKSACKSNLKLTFGISDTSDSLSCIEYSFDNLANKLTIHHINAGFNCCPDSIYCKVSLSNDTITIREFEKGGLCNCDCIYDLTIEVNGVALKKYLINLIEPYANDLEKLISVVDFSKDKIGSFCVTRKQYPWGVNSLTNL
jgi:hypothetical protein